MVTAFLPAKLDQFQGLRGHCERTYCLLLFWSCSLQRRPEPISFLHLTHASHILSLAAFSPASHKSSPPLDLLPARSNLSKPSADAPLNTSKPSQSWRVWLHLPNIQPQHFHLCNLLLRLLSVPRFHVYETLPLSAPFQHIFLSFSPVFFYLNATCCIANVKQFLLTVICKVLLNATHMCNRSKQDA